MAINNMEKKIYFKYLSAERAVQVISSGQIRFSQPYALNDAFELIPSLDIEEIKADYIKQNKNSNLKGLEEFTLGITHTFLEKYYNHGVLCLSSSFEIPLMWAHYAQNYSGVVIGLDVEEGLIPKQNEGHKFQKVDYSRNRFKYPNRNPFADFMFHKDFCWAYENEWRIVRPLDKLIDLSNDIFVSTFKPQAVRCVIYGPLINAEQRLKVYNALQSDAYSHVVQYVSHLDDETFEMDIDYLSSIYSDESSMVYSAYELMLRKHRDNMLSKGRLFKAMGLIPEDIKYHRFKDQVDLYTGELKNDHCT